MILELADIRIHPGQQAAFDHTIGFRQSPAFTEWRDIVGPFFAGAPNVEHYELLTKSK